MRADLITGGCQCGAVRYAISGALGRASICHCRMCQKAFGSFFAPLVSVAFRDFSVSRGAIAIFRSSDLVERGFCRDCGTPLTFREVDTDKIDVSIGSLDRPAAAKPTKQVGVESRLPWVGELADLPVRTTVQNDRAERLRQIADSNHQHPDHDTENCPESSG